jgi:hypothetical protein
VGRRPACCSFELPAPAPCGKAARRSVSARTVFNGDRAQPPANPPGLGGIAMPRHAAPTDAVCPASLATSRPPSVVKGALALRCPSIQEGPPMTVVHGKVSAKRIGSRRASTGDVDDPESPPTRRSGDHDVLPDQERPREALSRPSIDRDRVRAAPLRCETPGHAHNQEHEVSSEAGEVQAGLPPILTTPLATAYPPKRASRDRHLTLVHWTTTERTSRANAYARVLALNAGAEIARSRVSEGSLVAGTGANPPAGGSHITRGVARWAGRPIGCAV